MSGEIKIVPGYDWDTVNGEKVTLEKLAAQVADLTAQVAALSITERELADGAVTADKLDAEISGQLGLPDGSVTTAKLATTFLCPINKGGTGATTDADARTNLEAQRKEYHAVFTVVENGFGPGQVGGLRITHRFNTTEQNAITGLSLNTSTGVMSFPAGTYRVRFAGVAAGATLGGQLSHQVRLRDTTNNVTLGLGECCSGVGGIGSVPAQASAGICVFTLAGATDIELQHWANNDYLIGQDINSGEDNVYAHIHIEEIEA